MSDERAKNFIERLPEIIEREEQDVSHLDAEMLEILYPERADQSFYLGIVFGPPPAAGDAVEQRRAAYERAVGIAERSTRYRVEGTDRFRRHHASFGIDDVSSLHELFQLVGEFPATEVRVRGKSVPYGRELWLPMFWFFKKDPVET